MTPLFQLLEHGQSYWLDNLSREMIRSGELRRRVEEEGLRGVTSNPAIFHKAISSGDAYDDEIEALAADGASVSEIYERLVVSDIRAACDELRPVYDESHGADGFVSLEVSPRLIHDTQGTIDEGRRLWEAVDRPNLMIKVPGTPAGVPAIEELLFDGIHVNVTLLFDVPAYDEVVRAHLRALRRRLDAGRSPGDVASVASFFLSRIDVLVDSLIAQRIDADTSSAGPARLLGRAAIASAKFAYRSFERHYEGAEWDELAGAGARPQRLLWASTSSKNPLYDPVRYVEPLIGPDTVNTMPEVTIEAFAAAGRVVPGTIREGYEDAVGVFEDLDRAGIDMVAVAAQLVNEGADKFIGPFDRLLAGIAARRAEVRGNLAPEMSDAAAAALTPALVGALTEARFSRRLLGADASLWASGRDEREAVTHRLGWLSAHERSAPHFEEWSQLGIELANEGLADVVVLGMGGSSLAAAVLAEALPAAEGAPRLHVLDDIDPAAVRALAGRIDPASAVFVVASKSGSTAETLSLFRVFHGLVADAGVENPGARFIALTDPGTPLVALAHEHGFRRVIETPEDVGGRFSALTPFGLLPAAIAGRDVTGFLASAREMATASAAVVPLDRNPALGLGAVLGALGLDGRHRLTVVADPSLAPLATWLEQLVAESTGKQGVGILPVLGEPPLAPGRTAGDRVFLHLADGRGAPDPTVTSHLAALAADGHPVIRVTVRDADALGGEFLRWELAVAAAGALLGVNPFDEPNVAEAKERARGRLASAGTGIENGDGADIETIELFGDPEAAARLRAWLDGVESGGYVAALAYFAGSAERDRLAGALRTAIGERTGTTTTLGYGPRYLHSTGQLHKGGPAGGAFLILTEDAAEDVSVPGSEHSLAELRRAQALGDADALASRGRPVVRVNLGWYVDDGLAALAEAVRGGTVGADVPAGAGAQSKAAE